MKLCHDLPFKEKRVGLKGSAAAGGGVKPKLEKKSWLNSLQGDTENQIYK